MSSGRRPWIGLLGEGVHGHPGHHARHRGDRGRGRVRRHQDRAVQVDRHGVVAVCPSPGFQNAGRRRAAACVLRRVARVADDRGSSGVEFAILFPVIVVLLFGGPQLAMWYFAREAAQSAAAAGARAASVDGAASGAGDAAATSYLAKVGKGTITGYTVDETDAATTVTIHIHVTVQNVIPLPGFSPSADVTVTRGKERFTTPDSP